MKMVGLLVARTHAGCPWPGGPQTEFDRGDIVGFGKTRTWGDNVPRFMVRLLDGREVMVRVGDQDKPSGRWLRIQSKRLGHQGVVPKLGWAEKWMSICIACTGRERAGLEGQCPACANARTLAERAAERSGEPAR